MLLIGSRALKLRNPNLIQRNPLDFDWLCSEEEYHSWMKDNSHKVNPTKIYDLPEYNKKIVEGSINLEFEIITPGHSSELLNNLVNEDPDTIDTKMGKIPNLDILFTIKDSHKYKKFDLNASSFWKTAIDHFMMKEAGATIRPEYKEFHLLREKESYKNQLPKLNMSKKDFFDDTKNGVKQIYFHDDIHKAVALFDKPAYEYYLKDNEEVLTDKNKFFALPEEYRLAGAAEEAMTLAIERSLAPFPGVMTPQQAFQFALAKTASSITGGYFRKYTYENLFKILKTYPKDYYDRFLQAVESGKVRKLDATA